MVIVGTNDAIAKIHTSHGNWHYQILEKNFIVVVLSDLRYSHTKIIQLFVDIQDKLTNLE
jgi:hypothetical protein